MHSQQKTRALSDGVFVVGDAGPIGGADFAEGCAGLRHDVRDAERAANFHQFAAGDDYYAAFSERVEREENGGGVVVYYDGFAALAQGRLWRDGPSGFAQGRLSGCRHTSRGGVVEQAAEQA